MQGKKFKKPKAIMFDVSGTLTQSSFITKVLSPQFNIYHRQYVEENYNTPQIQEIIQKLSIAASLDSSAPKIELVGEKSAVVNAVCQYVAYAQEKNLDNKPLALLRFAVWFDSYDKNLILTPVYSDVAIQIQKWRYELDIKLFVLSNGWSEATKKFMEKTSQGNLAMLIQDYFDTEYGPLSEANTFTQIISKVGELPETVMFLTKSVDEALAARQTGIQSVLCLTHRKEVEAAVASGIDIPIVRTFNEIEFVQS